MMTQKSKVLELGYFLDQLDLEGTTTVDTLLATLEEGVILPVMWETVDEDGDPIGLLDSVVGPVQFSSFVEIPRMCNDEWDFGRYGLGFTQAFLEAQDVSPVNYIEVDSDIMEIDRETLVRNGLEQLLENWDSVQDIRHKAKTAMKVLQNDPEKGAYVHDMILNYTNETRTFYELVEMDDDGESGFDDSFAEWRGTGPIHFTLDDVQTIYVANLEDITAVRTMYPQYRGTFVVLS